MILNFRFQIPNSKFFVAAILLISAFCLPLVAAAQKRDHLTEKEGDLVREAQELDRRTDVFIKAAERRIALINGAPLAEKDAEKFGEPKGTKAQLLWDVSKILLEAIEKIDDVAARDEKNALLAKSIHALADASRQFLPQLAVFQSKYTDKMEQAAILSSIEYCNQIIEASTKIARPEEKKKKKN
jgi:hypothetical protein